MIIAIGSLKGGTGKSATTQNLASSFACAGYKVHIVDTDPQGSTTRWIKFRNQSNFKKAEAPEIKLDSITTKEELIKKIKPLYQKSGCDIMLIDGSPRLDEINSAIIGLVDLFIITLRVGLAEFLSTQMFLNKYEKAKNTNKNLRLFFLVTHTDPRWGKQSSQYKEIVEAVTQSFPDLPLFNTLISFRSTFSDIFKVGIGAVEYDDEKAKLEVMRLTKEINDLF